jgi:hypothetical protein
LKANKVDNHPGKLKEIICVKSYYRCAWWYVPVIPALGRLRQDCEFKNQPELHSKILSKQKEKKINTKDKRVRHINPDFTDRH